VTVSVIVCTYNRAEMMREAVLSLADLHTDGALSFEILIVNNASTDDTEAVAREICEACQSVPVGYVFAAKPGVSAARNAGIAAARGEWIAFMDDDQIAHPQWLTELLAAAKRRDVRCIGGVNRLRLSEGHAARQLASSVQSLMGATPRLNNEVPYTRRDAPGAGNLLVHRSVFEEIGTFDETLAAAGEDLDLYRRMWSRGIRAWCTPKAVTYHVVPAYRLESAYLRWKCHRNGGHLARRDLCDRGLLRMAINAALRMCQAAIVHLPTATWAGLTNNAEQLLGAKCLLWKAWGYVRYAAHYAVPRVFPQRRFLDWMDFRSERTAVAGTGPVTSSKGASTCRSM